MIAAGNLSFGERAQHASRDKTRRRLHHYYRYTAALMLFLPAV